MRQVGETRKSLSGWRIGPNKTARESALIHRLFLPCRMARNGLPMRPGFRKSGASVGAPRNEALLPQSVPTSWPSCARRPIPSPTFRKKWRTIFGMVPGSAGCWTRWKSVSISTGRARVRSASKTPNTSPAKTSFPDSSSTSRKYSSGSPQFASLSPQQHNEERAADERGDDAHGNFRGREYGAGGSVAENKKSGAEKERGRNKNTMVGAGHQSNRVRNDQVNEPYRSGKGRNCTGEDGTDKVRRSLQTAHIHTSRRRPFLASGKWVELAGYPDQCNEARDYEGCRANHGVHVRSIQ